MRTVYYGITNNYLTSLTEKTMTDVRQDLDREEIAELAGLQEVDATDVVDKTPSAFLCRGIEVERQQ